jgi:hypothetical protein
MKIGSTSQFREPHRSDSSNRGCSLTPVNQPSDRAMDDCGLPPARVNCIQHRQVGPPSKYRQAGLYLPLVIPLHPPPPRASSPNILPTVVHSLARGPCTPTGPRASERTVVGSTSGEPCAPLLDNLLVFSIFPICEHCQAPRYRFPGPLA